MNAKDYKTGLFRAVLTAGLFFAGCAEQLSRPAPTCPGKKSTREALNFLAAYSDEVTSFKANGQCLARFYADEKPRKENFQVKLWFNPPSQVRLQGEIAFNAKGIVLVSNPEEFWLAMKPKEAGNTYFWGRWDEQAGVGKLPIHPEILVEALGIIDIGDESDWSLSKEGEFDVLTKAGKDGAVIKKVYVPACDYRAAKIEYFDADNRNMITAELEYEKQFAAVSIPTMIKITSRTEDDEESSFRITVGSAKPFDFTPDRQEAFFSRQPEPKGFKRVYKVANGRLIRQWE